MNGSTCSISHVRDSGHRGSIGRRDWSAAQHLLHDYKISLRDIEDYALISKATVCRALDFKFFYRCEYLNLVRVRAAVEEMLLAAGWEAAHEGELNLTELWDDYEHRLEAVA